MNLKYKMSLLALALGVQVAGAQNLKVTEDAKKASYIMTSKDTVDVDFAAGFANVAVMSNKSDYKVEKTSENSDWVSFRKEKNGNLTVFAKGYYSITEPRYATLTLTAADGSCSHDLVVKQDINTSANSIGDKEIEIKSGTASSAQGGQGIENSFDGDLNSLWHSSWGGGDFPFEISYTFKEADHIDYMVYTPRSGGPNGNFGDITIYYATADNTGKWIKLGDRDCGKKNSPTVIQFGNGGLDNVAKVKIEIKSAGSDGDKNFASCAEMGFYSKDQSLNKGISEFFTSNLCYELKPNVGADDIDLIPHPYLRLLASNLLQGNYSTEFRVGEFGCYLDRWTLQGQLKTSMAYDNFENPTGIYFNKGDKIVVFAEGIDDAHPVQLCIANFSNANDIAQEGQPSSYYPLMNGANVIEAKNRGNGYVSYYSNDFENAPKVKLHFAMAIENGYFDASKHNNEDWVRMLANVKSDIFDVLTQRLHVAAPVANLKKRCPKKGETLAQIYDAIIYREREIMGLQKFGIEPKNHQFARPVKGGMFADGLGAAAAFGSFDEWVNPDNFGFWGMGHELGHINQIHPGFKWSGCGETTNNIYSAWVEHKVGAKDAFGPGTHRLEDEVTGLRDYSGMRGGRFEVYLEEGVRKGVQWQIQDGCDYQGTEPHEVKVQDQDENGNLLGMVTTTSRNYDHFVKVVPLWQLTLWTEEAGLSPNSYGRMIETYRKDFDQSKFNTSGKMQVEMIKRFCIAAGYDLTDFFEKAGMLKPIKYYVEDYAPNWNIITEEMCQKLKDEIKALNLKKAPAALNYINAYNWQTFRDQGKLVEGTVGAGCNNKGNKIVVDNDVWKNAVGYETYNSKGELIRISMFGLGDAQRSTRYTHVLFPQGEDASYIMAVGFDGTKVKCYQK